MAEDTTGTNEAEQVADIDAAATEVELSDEALDAVAGGQNTNSTMIVYASTFVPFDASF